MNTNYSKKLYTEIKVLHYVVEPEELRCLKKQKKVTRRYL